MRWTVARFAAPVGTNPYQLAITRRAHGSTFCAPQLNRLRPEGTPMLRALLASSRTLRALFVGSVAACLMLIRRPGPQPARRVGLQPGRRDVRNLCRRRRRSDIGRSRAFAGAGTRIWALTRVAALALRSFRSVTGVGREATVARGVARAAVALR